LSDRFTAAPVVRPVTDPWPRRTRLVEHSILPGFRLSLGITLVYLALIVLIPLSALALRPWEIGLDGVWRTLTEARVAAALKISFGL
jgi:sulfate transport system permease protein